MVFGIVVNRLLFKSPLTNALQIRYTLFITELGTEMVALSLHYCFNCAAIVADSAIESLDAAEAGHIILGRLLLHGIPYLLSLDKHIHLSVPVLPNTGGGAAHNPIRLQQRQNASIGNNPQAICQFFLNFIGERPVALLNTLEK